MINPSNDKNNTFLVTLVYRQLEEKSCTVYEGSHLTIPWTEFHTAPDGSQQLLYCIQFDDIEQTGSHFFETTTATVKRQYSDFVQLHASLEEVNSTLYPTALAMFSNMNIFILKKAVNSNSNLGSILGGCTNRSKFARRGSCGNGKLFETALQSYSR